MPRLLLTAILTLFVVCATSSSQVDARAQASRAAAPQVQAAAPKSTLPNQSDSVKFLVIGEDLGTVPDGFVALGMALSSMVCGGVCGARL